MTAVIMAGGKGTRIASVASDIPKPMIRVNDKPVLQYQIECLARNNLKKIILVIGHLGGAIKDYFRDGGAFGVHIDYYEETTPLGTAGALYKIDSCLDEDFILLNGDIIFDIDLGRLTDFHKEKKSYATLVSHPNSHPYDSSLLITDDERRVTGWLTKEDSRLYYKNEVNAGIHVLSKKLINCIKHEKEKTDLDRDILKPSIAGNHIFAYKTSEYIKDMGTPDRYEKVSYDIKHNIVFQKNLTQKQKAVFLDRDGTINIENGFIDNPEKFELLPGTAEALKIINDSGYLAIVITNQPVVARGETTIETLNVIHRKMETELGKYGAYLDDIYYCPHHPDKGFPGEIPELKIDCECRKPKPGMLFNAAKKYNIDLNKSWMVGDSERDIQAGSAAGCRTARVTEDSGLLDFVRKNMGLP